MIVGIVDQLNTIISMIFATSSCMLALFVQCLLHCTNTVKCVGSRYIKKIRCHHNREIFTYTPDTTINDTTNINLICPNTAVLFVQFVKLTNILSIDLVFDKLSSICHI